MALLLIVAGRNPRDLFRLAPAHPDLPDGHAGYNLSAFYRRPDSRRPFAFCPGIFGEKQPLRPGEIPRFLTRIDATQVDIEKTLLTGTRFEHEPDGFLLIPARRNLHEFERRALFDSERAHRVGLFMSGEQRHLFRPECATEPVRAGVIKIFCQGDSADAPGRGSGAQSFTVVLKFEFEMRTSAEIRD